MRRSGVALLLLALLIVADIVLVTGALRSTHVDTSKYAQAAPAPSGDVTDTPAPATATATAASAGTRPRASRVVVAGLTSTRAWRAITHVSACSDGARHATIGHTEDAGKRWTTVKVPLVTVSGLSYANGAVVATGLDTSCEPTTYALTANSAPGKTSSSAGWVIDPSDPTELETSGQPVAEQPCADGLRDVATNSGSDVVALCANGAVEHTTDTGATWNELSKSDGVSAIATGTDSVYVAGSSACGISVRSVDANTTGCVDGTAKWSGPIDITVVGGTLWLVSDTAAITVPVSSLDS